MSAMTFTDERFISSGTYVLVNAKYDRSIVFHRGENGDGRLVTSSAHNFEASQHIPDSLGYSNEHRIQWSITQLSSRKWTIKSQSHDVSISLSPDPEEGDELTTQHGQEKLHQWVIKLR